MSARYDTASPEPRTTDWGADLHVTNDDAVVDAPRTGVPGLARAGAIVVVGFVVARALGYVRVVATGAAFGASSELDAFWVAFRLPDLVLNLVATGALAASLVPALSGLLAVGNTERAWRTASSLLTAAGVAFALFGVFLFVAAPWLVPLLAPGFDDASTALAVQLTREMSPAPLILGVAALMAGALNATGRFAASVLGPIAYNVMTIVGALWLSGPFGVHGLAIGVVLGSIAYLLIQVIALLRTEFRFRRVVDLGDAGVRRAMGLLLPRAIGLSTAQLQLVVAVALASSLPSGSVTAFTIAYTLFLIPAGTLGVPIGTVALPLLAAHHAAGQLAEVGRLLTAGLRFVVFAMLPVVTVSIALAPELVALLFGYGRFDASDVATTAAAAEILFLGLPAEAMTALSARAMYAADKTAPTLLAAGVDLGATAVLALILVGPYGLAGLALAFAISAWIETLILLVALRWRVPGLRLAALARSGIAWLAVAVAVGVGVAIIADRLVVLDAPPHGRLALLVAVVACGGLAVAVYLGLAVAVRAPEVAVLRGFLQRRRRRGAGV